MVTPEAPVNVVKNAHNRIVTTTMPPGAQPNSARNSRTSRGPAPPSANR